MSVSLAVYSAMFERHPAVLDEGDRFAAVLSTS
jgi:hypothetical protein